MTLSEREQKTKEYKKGFIQLKEICKINPLGFVLLKVKKTGKTSKHNVIDETSFFNSRKSVLFSKKIAQKNSAKNREPPYTI